MRDLDEIYDNDNQTYAMGHNGGGFAADCTMDYHEPGVQAESGQAG